MSSVIRSRVRVAAVRIATLTCFGVLASTGVALADQSSDNAAVQPAGMTSYLGTTSTDTWTSATPSDAPPTSTTVIDTTMFRPGGMATPDPYRSG